MDRKMVEDFVLVDGNVDYYFGLKKEEMRYIVACKKFEDCYKIKFLDGKEMILDRKGSGKIVVAYVKELIQKKEIDEELKEKFENKANLDMLKEMSILKSNVDKLQKKLDAYEVSFLDNASSEIDSIKIEIPDFIKDMRNFDIISIRGNKEYYRKFKKFAVLMGISVTDFMNYLFYLAMEKLGR